MNTPLNLDLSNPDKFLLALLRARYPGGPAPLDSDEWDRAIAITEHLHPFIFDQHGREATADATRTLLRELDGLQAIDGGEYYRVPKVWLPIFTQAFRSNLINPIAYGAATRTILTDCDETPWNADQPLPDRLSALRDSDRAGMMTPQELDLWHALPAMVTIYRGGCTSAILPTPAAMEMAAGIHWTTEHSVAIQYMRGRSYARMHDKTAGLPAIVQATVPRGAVFAYCNNGESELLVDYERIAPEQVIDLGAVNYLSKPARIAA